MAVAGVKLPPASPTAVRNGAAPDLFGTQVAVPLVVHRATASSRRRKEPRAKIYAGPDDDGTKKKNGVGRTSSSGSGDKLLSPTPLQQPTPGGVAFP